MDRLSSWYAVRTATRRERKALAALNEQGFIAFMPCETRWRQDRFGKDVAYSPLIPGYIFVLIPEEQISAVHEIEGVHDFVRHMNDDGELEPVRIPGLVVLDLQARERQGEFDRTITKRKTYRPRKGEEVQIAAGAYMGFAAKVLATPRGERAKLLVESFSPPRRVSIDLKHLRAA